MFLVLLVAMQFLKFNTKLNFLSAMTLLGIIVLCGQHVHAQPTPGRIQIRGEHRVLIVINELLILTLPSLRSI
jgi:hypothetical protein